MRALGSQLQRRYARIAMFEPYIDFLELEKVYRIIQKHAPGFKVTIEAYQDPECGDLEQLIMLHVPPEYTATDAILLTDRIDDDMFKSDMTYTVHIRYS